MSFYSNLSMTARTGCQHGPVVFTVDIIQPLGVIYKMRYEKRLNLEFKRRCFLAYLPINFGDTILCVEIKRCYVMRFALIRRWCVNA